MKSATRGRRSGAFRNQTASLWCASLTASLGQIHPGFTSFSTSRFPSLGLDCTLCLQAAPHSVLALAHLTQGSQNNLSEA